MNKAKGPIGNNPVKEKQETKASNSTHARETSEATGSYTQGTKIMLVFKSSLPRCQWLNG